MPLPPADYSGGVLYFTPGKTIAGIPLTPYRFGSDVFPADPGGYLGPAYTTISGDWIFSDNLPFADRRATLCQQDASQTNTRGIAVVCNVGAQTCDITFPSDPLAQGLITGTGMVAINGFHAGANGNAAANAHSTPPGPVSTNAAPGVIIVALGTLNYGTYVFTSPVYDQTVPDNFAYYLPGSTGIALNMNPPANLRHAVPDCEGVDVLTFAWDAVLYATSYDVEVTASGGNYSPPPLYASTITPGDGAVVYTHIVGTTFQLRNVALGASYSMRVLARTTDSRIGSSVYCTPLSLVPCSNVPASNWVEDCGPAMRTWTQDALPDVPAWTQDALPEVGAWIKDA